MMIVRMIGYGLTVWIMISAVVAMRHQHTADELFGCARTYVDERGEDTGECP